MRADCQSGTVQLQARRRLPMPGFVHRQNIHLPLRGHAQRAAEAGDEHDLGQRIGDGATGRGNRDPGQFGR